MNKRETAERNYRQKFEALGLDFTFLRREWSQPHDRRFWVRCNRCGAESLRTNDVLRGRQKKLLCKSCGNGRLQNTALVDEMVEYYQSGHAQTEVAEHFNVKRSSVAVLLRRRRATNGREFNSASGNENRLAINKEKALQTAHDVGLILLEEWRGKRYTYKVMDTRTWTIEEVSGASLLPHKSRPDRNREVIIDDPDISIVSLLKRDGRQCYICGKETTFRDTRWGRWGPDYPTIDHIKPIKLGGHHSWDNVKVCCGLCNAKKGARYDGKDN